uniref:Uncharacterized protein n=1 Tax=Tetraselmis sp. GSL018 TaxID=582737 RepID=A0A061QP56_9CHLO
MQGEGYRLRFSAPLLEHGPGDRGGSDAATLDAADAKLLRKDAGAAAQHDNKARSLLFFSGMEQVAGLHDFLANEGPTLWGRGYDVPMIHIGLEARAMGNEHPRDRWRCGRAPCRVHRPHPAVVRRPPALVHRGEPARRPRPRASGRHDALCRDPPLCQPQLHAQRTGRGAGRAIADRLLRARLLHYRGAVEVVGAAGGCRLGSGLRGEVQCWRKL